MGKLVDMDEGVALALLNVHKIAGEVAAGLHGLCSVCHGTRVNAGEPCAEAIHAEADKLAAAVEAGEEAGRQPSA